ncbi:MAG: hypothetical protein EBR01_03425 [Proteobacteria bacterium]|nr:hypothetical protein [Pseudomonadota bacterium]NBY20863.1 hypothetical protein [bacterium]
MKKAATKPTGTVSLGNKRSCKKCQAKFYDFNKEEIECPKCKHVMTQGDFSSSFTAKSESKKKSSEKITTEGLMQGDDSDTPAADPFEEDDLAEDAEDVVEEIEVEEDDNDF